MTNLFTNLSKNVLCTVVGPILGRGNTENGPIKSWRVCAVLVMLCLSVGNVWATLTTDSISSSAVTSLVNGGKYVIRAGTSQNKYLAAKNGTWGSSVAIGSAYIFTVTVDKDGFYANCKDGTLTPATSNFSAYGSVTKSNLTLNASGYIANKSSTTYYLQANSSSSYKFRWYNSSQTKARMYQVGNNIFFTQPGFGSIAATSTTSTFNSTLNLMPAVYTGKTATLTATPPSGYAVDAWTVKKKSDNSDVTATVLAGTTLTMPAYDVIVSVTWKSAGPACADPSAPGNSSFF